MLDNNADLAPELEKDPKLFNQAYSSLRSVNMQFAQDPLIAGHYMRQIMSSPVHAGGKLELALMGGQGQQGPMDRVSNHMFEGAKGGLSKASGPPADPHADLRSKVEGVKLRETWERQQQRANNPGGGGQGP